jgi:hypothetical protein
MIRHASLLSVCGALLALAIAPASASDLTKELDGVSSAEIRWNKDGKITSTKVERDGSDNKIGVHLSDDGKRRIREKLRALVEKHSEKLIDQADSTLDKSKVQLH